MASTRSGPCGVAGRLTRLLFIRTDRLGETLLNLPAAVAAKRACPGATLSLLVHPALAPLLAHAPEVDEILTYTDTAGTWLGRAGQLSWRLRKYRFDLAVVSNPKKELHVAVWLARIPVRVGYDRKWGSLLTHRLRDRKALGERHEVEYNQELLHALGLPCEIPEWQFPALTHERSELFQLLEQHGVVAARPYIVIHPWTSNPAKQWPSDRYRALIDQVTGSLGVQVVVVGGQDEVRKSGGVLSPGSRVANLVGRTSLTQLAALLQCATLIVSNDSGPMHLAAAVGTRTIALFGAPTRATGPVRWGPWGKGHRVVWKPSMDAITVEEVLRTVEQALKEPRQPRATR